MPRFRTLFWTKFLGRAGDWGFVVPTVVGLFVLIVYPLLNTVSLSLHKVGITNISSSSWEFVGAGNYLKLLVDPYFRSSFLKTLFFSVSSVTVELALGMGLALALNRELKGKNILSTILLFPVMMTPVAVGLIWRFMLNSEVGIINYGLTLAGIQGRAWLAVPGLAMFTAIATDVWISTPFVFLVLSAGLAGLPAEPYEAARIDGATRWQVFRYITLPLLSPALVTVALIRFIDTMKAFDLVYALTQGGPGTATELINIRIYKEAFLLTNLGYASAMSVALLLIILVIAYFLYRRLQRQE